MKTRLCLILILCCSILHAANLEKDFKSPPASARPWVYWFWLNGNITREGITADLEAMKRVGIGGVLIMEVDQGAPVGPVDFMGDQWRVLFKFVEYPEVPSENNGAERALRPAVITRKVCGGTRSQKGSETKMTLMSLFGTWHVRGLDMLDLCRQLLAGKSVLFPEAT